MVKQGVYLLGNEYLWEEKWYERSFIVYCYTCGALLLAKGTSTIIYSLLFEQQVVETIKEKVKPECLVGEQKWAKE